MVDETIRAPRQQSLGHLAAGEVVLRHGRELSVGVPGPQQHGLAAALGVANPTVDRYIDLLVDLQLLRRRRTG